MVGRILPLPGEATLNLTLIQTIHKLRIEILPAYLTTRAFYLVWHHFAHCLENNASFVCMVA